MTRKNGCIYLRGCTWWVKYYQRGKAIYESTKSDDRRMAEKLLVQREIEAEQDKLPNFHAERTKWDEIAEGYLLEYKLKGRRSIKRAKQHVESLRPYFEGTKAHDINIRQIQKYIVELQAKGLANGSINRGLSALRKMFNLAIKQGKVLKKPYIEMLEEDNTRTGFFEHDEFISLRAVLPEHLRGIVTIAYFTGMRKSEITGLCWSHLDLAAGIIRLSGKDTKTKKARTIPLNDECWGLLVARKKERDINCPSMPFVFYSPQGDPIENFRKVWLTATKKVGLEGMIFHDFRRTAIRNMIRSGVPEQQAMRISGHKTRSVFDRYDIVSEEDLRIATKKMEVYINAKQEAENPYRELEEAEMARNLRLQS